MELTNEQLSELTNLLGELVNEAILNERVGENKEFGTYWETWDKVLNFIHKL